MLSSFLRQSCTISSGRAVAAAQMRSSSMNNIMPAMGLLPNATTSTTLSPLINQSTTLSQCRSFSDDATTTATFDLSGAFEVRSTGCTNGRMKYRIVYPCLRLEAHTQTHIIALALPFLYADTQFNNESIDYYHCHEERFD
jgi:hypothetical protein